MAKADLHVHTTHSAWRHLRFIHPRDSYSTPLDVYRRALAAGMDFVAVTDHDAVEGALRLLDEPGVEPSRVLVGEEVECRFPETGQWVHVNVLGLGEEDHRALQRIRGDVREVVALCRERRLLAVLNHPFQSYRGQKSVEAYVEDILSLFTHVEGLNGSVSTAQNRAVNRLCAESERMGLRLVEVGGSDAHTLRRVGAAWTEADGGTAADYLEQVRAGRCRVGGTAQPVWGLVRDVHAVIGTYYLRLVTGRGDAPTAASYAADVLVSAACLPAAFGPFPTALSALHQARQQAVSRLVTARLERVDWGRCGAVVRAATR